MATGASGVVNRPTIVSLFLICALSSNIIAQSRTKVVNGDSLTIFTHPMKDKFEIEISIEVSKKDESLVYNYSIENKLSSEQNVWYWLIISDSKIHSIKSPSNWSYNESGNPGRISWASKKAQFRVKPGEVLDGFGFTSKELPTIKPYFMEGWAWIILQAGQEPDSVENSSFFDTAKKGHMIFPQENRIENTLEFTDTLETFRFRSCEELNWATNSGVCGELKNDLSDIKANLQAGDSLSAANALSDFIKLVEQEKDKSLTSEGYALLYFNAEYLRRRLVGEN
ncbi:MAG: hypothetical protein JJ895_11525 [Balneolaceae bacterium]|nr:hypothetical protein [Balneolaceae bacterium]